MSADLDKRITEWAIWYHENLPRLPKGDLLKRMDFMQKALDGAFECIAIATKDIQVLEDRKPSARLWLPTGMKASGDFRRFG